MFDPAPLIAGLTIGGSLGCIAGLLIASGRIADLLKDFDKVAKTADDADRRCRALEAENMEWARREVRRMKPLHAANEARKQARLAREASAHALRNTRHAELRTIIGDLVP